MQGALCDCHAARTMANLLCFLFLTLVCELRTSSAIQDYSTVFNMEFPMETYLDDRGEYRMLWNTNETTVVFRLEVKTSGYVGFGISPKGDMKNADIMMAWIADGVANVWVSRTVT